MSDDIRSILDAGTGETPADQPKRCANCGDRIDVKEWHPVIAERDDDGQFHLYAFCDDTCRQVWEAD